MKICPVCLKENPIKSKFCYNCGFKFQEIKEKDQTRGILCLNCRKDNPLGNRFCLYCGTPLKVNLRSQNNQNIINQDKTLSAYWYCSNDKSLMKETSKNHQFPISKKINISIEKLIEMGKIREDQKILAHDLAQNIFTNDPAKNFAIITRVRCPICMRDSLAPVYTRPNDQNNIKNESRNNYYPISKNIRNLKPIYYQERLTFSTMISNGLYFITNNMIILIIPIIFYLIELIFSLTPIEINSFGTIFVWILELFTQNYSQNNFINLIFTQFLGFFLNLIMESLFITVLIIFYLEIERKTENQALNHPPVITRIIELFPKIFITKGIIGLLLSFGFAFDTFLDYSLLNIILNGQIISLEGNLIYLFSFLISFVLWFLPLVLFSYVPFDLAINKKSGIIKCFSNSMKFSRKFPSATFLMNFLFLFLPILFFNMLPILLWEIGVPVLLIRLFDTIQIISFLWAFNKYKELILTEFNPNIVDFSDIGVL